MSDPVSGVSLNDIVAITIRRGIPITVEQDPPDQQLAIFNFGATGKYALDGVLPVFIAPLLSADQSKLSDRFAFNLDVPLDVGEDGVTDGAVPGDVTWRRFFSVVPDIPEDYSDIGGKLEEGMPLAFWANESMNIYRSLMGFDFDVNNSSNLDSEKSILVFGTIPRGNDTETRESFVVEQDGFDIGAFTTVAVVHDSQFQWENFYDVVDSRYPNPRAGSIALDPTAPAWMRLLSTEFKSVVHEQGHTLGLAHPGTYNGNINSPSEFLWTGDSWDESIMSYAQQPKTYELFGNTEGFALLNLTPRTLDLLALDQIYEQQVDSQGKKFGTHRAFVGDTRYGFNTNITEDQSIVYANLSELYNYRIATTIADGEGNDTIDASGFKYGNTIDLYVMTGEETSSRLSKLNGNIGNLSFAVGTIIENAIGGDKDDKFYDNQYDNKLVGNGGNDWFSVSGGKDKIVGGRGIDTVEIQGKEEDFIINRKSSSKVVVAHGERDDFRMVLKGVEQIEFANVSIIGKEVGEGIGVGAPVVVPNDELFLLGNQSESALVGVSDMIS